jgi:hypothetical protein
MHREGGNNNNISVRFRCKKQHVPEKGTAGASAAAGGVAISPLIQAYY